MKNLYDKNLPLEYHFINIHIKTNTVKEKSTINGLVLNIDEIKNSALLVINNSRNKLNTEIISDNHFSLTDKDPKNIQRAEAFLKKIVN